jgi:hypothetical protein
MPNALTPPAVLKLPPATMSPFGSVVRALTKATVVPDQLSPEPNADQLVPSHRAMRLALTPPTLVK